MTKSNAIEGRRRGGQGEVDGPNTEMAGTAPRFPVPDVSSLVRWGSASLIAFMGLRALGSGAAPVYSAARPGALEILPDVGHMAPITHPDVVGAALLRHWAQG